MATHLIAGESGDSVPITSEICAEIGAALGGLRACLVTLGASLPTSERFDHRGERFIQSLPQAATSLSWPVDAVAISAQFYESLSSIRQCTRNRAMQLIHTDVRPPNTIVRNNHLAGVVDFDDLAIGPPVLDLAVAFAEFTFDPRDDALNYSTARALFNGYRSVYGPLGKDAAAIVPCVVFTYASWLACNVLNQVPYLESEVFDRRLRRFRNKDRYREICGAVNDLLRGLPG